MSRFGPSGEDMLAFSRAAMQDLLSDLTKQHTPGLTYLYGKVNSVLLAKDQQTIDRVRVKSRGGAITCKDCNLVLDCSGGARCYRRLIKGNNNFAEPELERYNMNVAYSSATIDIDDSIVKRLPLPVPLQGNKQTWSDVGIVLLVSPLLTESSSHVLMIHTDNNRCESFRPDLRCKV